MPLYEYRCFQCGAIHTEFRRVANCDDPGPECCGNASRKIISRQSIVPPMEAYESPIDGRVISTRSQRLDDLKRNHCRPYEGFRDEQIEAQRQRQYQAQEQERAIGHAVESAYRSLPENSKRVLSA